MHNPEKYKRNFLFSEIVDIILKKTDLSQKLPRWSDLIGIAFDQSWSKVLVAELFQEGFYEWPHT